MFDLKSYPGSFLDGFGLE